MKIDVQVDWMTHSLGVNSMRKLAIAGESRPTIIMFICGFHILQLMLTDVSDT